MGEERKKREEGEGEKREGKRRKKKKETRKTKCNETDPNSAGLSTRKGEIGHLAVAPVAALQRLIGPERATLVDAIRKLNGKEGKKKKKSGEWENDQVPQGRSPLGRGAEREREWGGKREYDELQNIKWE
ncbi:hypothetical protein AWENTII_010120 [Aspergillus wentii]